jgi:hypothetical protein
MGMEIQITIKEFQFFDPLKINLEFTLAHSICYYIHGYLSVRKDYHE